MRKNNFQLHNSYFHLVRKVIFIFGTQKDNQFIHTNIKSQNLLSIYNILGIGVGISRTFP